MSRKRKAIDTRGRPNVRQCPHCGGALPARPGDEGRYITVSDEERYAIMRNAMAHVCRREGLLALLAHYQPALRALVADVYPLPAEEIPSP
jgi:hypothetical protein